MERTWIGHVLFLMAGFTCGIYVMRVLEQQANTVKFQSMDPIAMELLHSAHSETDKCVAEREVLKAQKESLAQQLAAYITAGGQQMGASRELLSEATVLFEPAPVDPRLQAVQTILTLAGHPVPLPMISGMRPRWFIPAKIKPTVYGDPRGMQLIYVDAQGHKQGPFAPEILPQ